VPIAITDDHKALADAVSQLLSRRDARAAARALLETPTEEKPAFWADLVGLGLPGLHVPEEYGGASGDLTDLVVAVEELGAALTPGAFVPSAIASAVLVATGDDAAKKTLLPGLADGSRTAAVALAADVELTGGSLTGKVPVALGAGTADLLVLPVGDDVVVVDARAGEGVAVGKPPNQDPTPR
jgi:alkylation response protein AidB-like acyl-CoA dehydrogenase